ncbi:MAG TPA: hypothetical protein VNE38_04010 [Ktedonobacteraceae bacterium]|nr:hypothetical protein [Ktedonobacteraceae bacterium]
MTISPASLAQIVARAQIQRLSLIGLAKNVGKTTATNHLLQSFMDDRLYRPGELALTSLGLDGEATDAMTGLPKPRYVPQTGLLIATTDDLLRQAEGEGARFERLQQLPGRTAIGPVFLARVQHAGRIIIAGPTLLRDLSFALSRFSTSGARLSIVDGAINRLGAAAPAVTDACILCTGASVAATPELVARRTVDVLTRLMTRQSTFADAYMKFQAQARLLCFSPIVSDHITLFTGTSEPEQEARWIVAQMNMSERMIYFLHGALTEELTRALLTQLPQQFAGQPAELVIEDPTRMFCHSVTLQRLAARGLAIRVARTVRVLAITINPYTPDYQCFSQQLLDALLRELPENYPPVIDVISGIFHGQSSVTS